MLVAFFVGLFPLKLMASSFDQNLIISDYSFTNSSSMTQAQIESFLVEKNSFWVGTNYVIPATVENVRFPYKDDLGNNAWGTVNVPQDVYLPPGLGSGFIENLGGKTVSEVIFKYSTELSNYYGISINPQVILSLMQRESSSILNSANDGSKFKESELNKYWPLYYCYNETMASFGYNYTDARQRTLDFGGVGLQVVYAMRNFKNKFQNSNLNTIIVGTSSSPLDNAQITISPQSKATRLLYVYTPWIRPGQENFYNNFNSWFGDPTYTPSTPDPGPQPPDKAGDCARDGVVDSTDLSILADSWGKTVSVYTQGDLSGDGLVDSTDLSILADGWGK